MKTPYLFLTFGLGFLLAAVGFSSLNSVEGGIQPDRNPFAIQQSGYGKTLARLSQNTVNEIWHLGIEQVNPVGHDHANCDHDHGQCDHGHDDHAEEVPEERDSAAMALAWLGLSDSDRNLLTESGIERNAVHCAECLDTVMGSLKKGEPVSHDDLPAIHAFHQMTEDEDDHGHEGHDHAGHGHLVEAETDAQGDRVELVAGAKDWLIDLKEGQYNRNSPFAISESHRRAVAADIENLLLRGYQMDPTDYGVYNAYYLFLTVHELGGTPAAREHARLISRLTVAEARKETVDPQPWLTACMAWLNLFFLDQEDMKEKGEEPPAEMLEAFRDQMRYCLHQFAVAREQAVAEGRWEEISADRRSDMLERERFSKLAIEQFGAMLARASGDNQEEQEAKKAAGEPLLNTNPVVENAGTGSVEGE